MITQNWIDEFRGLFWGEGCADIQRYHNGKGIFFRPRLRIQLRADDAELLKDIQAKLGGTLNYIENKNQKSKPAYQWTLSNKEEVSWVCERLLEGKLPSRKIKQIELVKEAADLRKGKLGHIKSGERVRLNELYESARKLKLFE